MNKIYKNNVKAIKKYYDNATKEQVIEDTFLDICDLQQRIDKAIQFIKEHNKNAGKLYYKYNNKYLLSEIKEDLLEILGGKE